MTLWEAEPSVTEPELNWNWPTLVQMSLPQYHHLGVQMWDQEPANTGPDEYRSLPIYERLSYVFIQIGKGSFMCIPMHLDKGFFPGVVAQLRLVLSWNLRGKYDDQWVVYASDLPTKLYF
jgi:hypothetical protein